MFLDYYANPYRFESLAKKILPFFFVCGTLLLCAGLYIGLFASPPDYQQKETVRIMYIHVPSAWLGMGCFVGMGLSSIFFLIRRHQLGYIIAKTTAPIGLIFSLICLITGSLWGRPTWGTYWIWDARLTSMLILFFLYMAYILINTLIQDFHKAAKVSSIFALVGLIDIPIIKFSVEWWNTLHQKASVVRSGGPSIDASMLTPLLVTASGLMLLVIALIFLGTLTELNRLKIKRHYRQRVYHE